MLLKRISYRIALQFTGFVFLCFMINGAAFLLADFQHARRIGDFRLQKLSFVVMDSVDGWPSIRIEKLPPHLRNHIRIIGLQGQPVYVGGIFADTPFSGMEGKSDMTFQGQEYGVFTIPLMRRGVPLGFLQVAQPEGLQLGDLPERVGLYLLISFLISALTFFVGLFFARRSLKPAEQMMERLEQFTQDASHELKTPLAALRSSLDLALKNGKYKEGIESARDDVRTLTTLVERLLELARLDQLNIEKLTIDAGMLVRDTVERHTALITEQSLQLSLKIDDPVLIEGDAALLRQLITNLLSNAMKFTPAGGIITVALSKKQLSVADTGIGIAPKSLPHLFDRFFQVDTSRSRGGFGLGLALVKRIADLHGWIISVQSEEGKGSTFTIRFSA